MVGQVRQTRSMVDNEWWTVNGDVAQRTGFLKPLFLRKHTDQNHSGLLLTITFKDSKPDLSLPAVCLECSYLLHNMIRRSPVFMECLIESWDSTATSTNSKPWFAAIFHHYSEGSTRLSLDVIMEGVRQYFYYRFLYWWVDKFPGSPPLYSTGINCFKHSAGVSFHGTLGGWSEAE